MSFLTKDRVKETSTTTGTGTLTLAGAATGFQSFSAIGDGNSCYYCIAHQSAAEWEVGIGTYTASGTTLSRDKVLASSNSGNAVSLSAGTKDVFVTFPAAIAESAHSVCEGRLTLTSGTAVTTSDVTGATSVYFTPYNGNRLGIYNGSGWQVYRFAELTLALGTLTSALPYDVFVYDNAGTLTLESLAWTNGTTRATALALQDGVYVKSGATTRRYLGTFYTTSTTTTEDSVAKRFLWNAYNRVRRPMVKKETTDTWTYTTATYRAANNSTTNRLEMIRGLDVDPIIVSVQSIVNNTTGGTPRVAVGIGIDSTSVNSAHVFGGNAPSSGNLNLRCEYSGFPGVGYHYAQWLEYSGASGTTLWIGDNGSPTEDQCGIIGEVLA